METSCLSGKVLKVTLPEFDKPADAAQLCRKRLKLVQGELAQLYDDVVPIHYIAMIELRQGTSRGNHFHKIKEEYVYVLQGKLNLLLADTVTQTRDQLDLSAGDMVIIQPGIAHTLQVVASGSAIEFSPSRFDAGDIYRQALE